ncbi:MAG TPA: hypothetical protein PLK36_04610 [Methanoregulaceae archaeon]|nr:hypothetical protein [Methanoregulaceae archaeon]HQN89337.1 hypothetical protein [Methanoregulaceae archaeon]HQP81834.1 hypothetical protein [Methanoregulaceae archaeon]
MIKSDGFSCDSGVSETIGFVVILGIVITGIAMVTLYGYPALIQEQQNTNVKNMQKNMFVIQSDLRSLTAKGVPYQETAIQVSGGTLMVKKDPDPNTPRFEIQVNNANSTITHTPGELKFVSQDGSTTIALENGAVLTRYQSDPNGSVMLAQPAWFYDTQRNTYVIHLIKLNAKDDFSQTGIGTVRMMLSEPPSTIQYNNPTTITYHANHAEDYMKAWENYFGTSDLGMTPQTPSGRTITCDLDPSAKLVIKTYNVTILSL